MMTDGGVGYWALDGVGRKCRMMRVQRVWQGNVMGINDVEKEV
jgi:hypothetical protein